MGGTYQWKKLRDNIRQDYSIAKKSIDDEKKKSEALWKQITLTRNAIFKCFK